ncbi:hypothetical protein C8R47DRAFT_393488 [Mycena vitilis]|nr:hypothetical protein C8R47DRAFT_393488 [Mycena vitilis]
MPERKRKTSNFDSHLRGIRERYLDQRPEATPLSKSVAENHQLFGSKEWRELHVPMYAISPLVAHMLSDDTGLRMQNITIAVVICLTLTSCYPEHDRRTRKIRHPSQGGALDTVTTTAESIATCVNPTLADAGKVSTPQLYMPGSHDRQDAPHGNTHV